MKKLLIIFIFLLSCKKEEIKHIVKQKDDTVLLNYRIYGFVPDSSSVYINGKFITDTLIGYHIKCKLNDTLYFYFSKNNEPEQTAKQIPGIANLAVWIDRNELYKVTYFNLIKGVNSNYIQTKYVVK